MFPGTEVLSLFSSPNTESKALCQGTQDFRLSITKRYSLPGKLSDDGTVRTKRKELVSVLVTKLPEVQSAESHNHQVKSAKHGLQPLYKGQFFLPSEDCQVSGFFDPFFGFFKDCKPKIASGEDKTKCKDAASNFFFLLIALWSRHVKPSSAKGEKRLKRKKIPKQRCCEQVRRDKCHRFFAMGQVF